MNKKQAIKQVENVRHQVEVMLKDYRNVFDDIFSDDDIQALDIAIESLIKQSEYDMYTHNVEFQLKLAEKKLNELGYAFNEYRGCIIAIDKADEEEQE